MEGGDVFSNEIDVDKLDGGAQVNLLGGSNCKSEDEKKEEKKEKNGENLSEKTTSFIHFSIFPRKKIGSEKKIINLSDLYQVRKKRSCHSACGPTR